MEFHMNSNIEHLDQQQTNGLGKYVRPILAIREQNQSSCQGEEVQYIKPTCNFLPKEQLTQPPSEARRRSSNLEAEIPVSQVQSSNPSTIVLQRANSRVRVISVEKHSSKDGMIQAPTVKEIIAQNDGDVLYQEDHCNNCQKLTATKVEDYSSGTQCGWCVAMGLCGLWPICWVPFMVKACDLKIYKCQKCDRKKSKYDPSCFPCWRY